MKMLLDTVSFLWLILDSPRLSRAAREAFADPANDVYLSAVSTWEIAVKYSLGRLKLPAAPAQYIPDQRERHAIQFLPLDESSTLHLARLPDLHRDPFDRMLICQALLLGLVIVTPDAKISQYPVRALW